MKYIKPQPERRRYGALAFCFLEVNNVPYIHFTEDQKLRASEVDLAEFLRHQGEKLIRSGPEYRLASDHSVTVRGNEWFDHATKEGGGPISFVQNFYNLSYPEAAADLFPSSSSSMTSPTPRPSPVCWAGSRASYMHPRPSSRRNHGKNLPCRPPAGICAGPMPIC